MQSVGCIRRWPVFSPGGFRLICRTIAAPLLRDEWRVAGVVISPYWCDGHDETALKPVPRAERSRP